MTYEEWAERYGVTVKINRSPVSGSRPPWDDPHWNGQAWKVKITGRDGSMMVDFYTGSAINEAEPADVLDCLASDFAGIDNAGHFLDWAPEYGYDTDSIKALDAYRAIEKQRADFHGIDRGQAFYDALLYEVERL